MKFGEFDVADAEGVLLAHSLKVAGQHFRKGRRLTAEDLSSLRQAAHVKIYGAQLETDDVPENVAARELAEVLCGSGTRPGRPGAGHCNLVATEAGLASLNPDAVRTLNLIDPDLLVATAPAWQRVAPGDLVARIKIASFAIAGKSLQHAKRIITDANHSIAVHPFHARRIGLILTEQTETDGKRSAALRIGVHSRLSRLGNSVQRELLCAHNPQAVASAVTQLHEEGCDLLIIGAASATVDKADVVPAGIVASGGHIERYGFPLEPGSMLLLAELDDATVVVLPGCARSVKPNGLDQLLDRLIARQPPTQEEIAAWGCGGLLPGQRDKPQAARAPNVMGVGNSMKKHKIAAVVLAAGHSRRMGETNKLLAPLHGLPLIAHVVNSATSSIADPVIVVTGHEQELVHQALKGRSVEYVHNAEHESGLASSVRTGLAALPDDMDGAIFLLGDMPLVGAGHINQIIDAFNSESGRTIIVPVCDGARGNPVLWSKEFFPEMSRLTGDTGARKLLRDYPDKVFELEIGDNAVLTDIDTVETLREIEL